MSIVVQDKFIRLVTNRLGAAPCPMRDADLGSFPCFCVGTEEFRGNRTGDEGRSKQQMVLSSEVQEAEARLASSRAALAEAKAALRHASEALQAHKELEMVGEVGMMACCDGLL